MTVARTRLAPESKPRRIHRVFCAAEKRRTARKDSREEGLLGEGMRAFGEYLRFANGGDRCADFGQPGVALFRRCNAGKV